MLAACMMLEHIGDIERAARIRHALETTIREGKTVTRDLGGTRHDRPVHRRRSSPSCDARDDAEMTAEARSRRASE